jgi:hypothetical protein
MPVLPALPANNPFRINGRLLERYLDTVEVRSSSLLVPTISFNQLAALTSFRKAPNGSIKRAEPGRAGGSTLPRTGLRARNNSRSLANSRRTGGKRKGARLSLVVSWRIHVNRPRIGRLQKTTGQPLRTAPLLLRLRFDFSWQPRLVEPWFERTVETKDHEPTLFGDGLYPVVRFARGCFRTEVNVH